MNTKKELELLADHYSMKELLSMVAYKCTYPNCQHCLMLDSPTDTCTLEKALEDVQPIKDWDKIEVGRYGISE